MATLEGNFFQEGECRLTLSPVPNVAQKTTEYYFAWSTASGIDLKRTFSVEGWFTPEDDLWAIARTFSEVETLAGLRIPAFSVEGWFTPVDDLWCLGKGVTAYMVESIDWLHVTLFANQKRQVAHIDLFVRDEIEPMFSRLGMCSSLVATKQFGDELEREILEANPLWVAENEIHRVKNESTDQT